MITPGHLCSVGQFVVLTSSGSDTDCLAWTCQFQDRTHSIGWQLGRVIGSLYESQPGPLSGAQYCVHYERSVSVFRPFQKAYCCRMAAVSA